MTLQKTLIFTVTSGRSGSSYLSHLLSAVPGVHAEHEPEPNFVHVMRRAQQNAPIAVDFLREQKLPAIAGIAEPVYAETSHLTCKGFIEPMIRMGLRPGLILLGRPPREVAWSLLERTCIPGRTPLGFSYLLQPNDPFVLPLPGWELLSDYKLCFWYALEMERRTLRYAGMARILGMPVTVVTNRQLNDWSHFSRVLSGLNLPTTDDVRRAHADISRQYHNPNAARRQMPSEDELRASEEPIWNRVSNYEPLLQAAVQERYGSTLEEQLD